MNNKNQKNQSTHSTIDLKSMIKTDSVHRQRVRKWAILDDESEKWSTHMEEFYLNGDAPHIQGCVGRMMHCRQRQQQKEGARDMRWSILPPQFYDYLVDSCTKNTVSFANAKSSPFPSFF
ncbi:hypothetical protein E3N88_25584 [Mikania micrantha]|uniref:Uncharacterized protein n=1 Tax=Mikania micrantha TaxID=192012 RepID=A0A5N6N6K5_9ASTR|nr:hypothetical protein E3N88_25584 [Mikania micrantha]